MLFGAQSNLHMNTLKSEVFFGDMEEEIEEEIVKEVWFYERSMDFD